jgi:hypothetical protein
MTTKVPCPTCGESVVWNTSSEFRPFCSKRCQLIDLGEWADESHKISTPIMKEKTFTNEEIEDIEALLAQQEDSFFKH